jgi:hypothetical protein
VEAAAAAAAKIYTSSGTTLQSSSFLMEHAYTSNPRSPVPPKKKLLLSAATFKTQCTNEYTLETICQSISPRRQPSQKLNTSQNPGETQKITHRISASHSFVDCWRCCEGPPAFTVPATNDAPKQTQYQIRGRPKTSTPLLASQGPKNWIKTAPNA